MTKPLTPDEVRERHVERKKEDIPPVVFEEFNDELLRQYNGFSARIEQDDIVKRLEDRGISRSDIFAKDYLDIEPHYREAGWQVTYHKPVYYGGESFPHHWIFKRAKEEG